MEIADAIIEAVANEDPVGYESLRTIVIVLDVVGDAGFEPATSSL